MWKMIKIGCLVIALLLAGCSQKQGEDILSQKQAGSAQSVMQESTSSSTSSSSFTMELESSFAGEEPKIPAPVQLKNVKSLAGIHVLRISADGELGELREFETHIDIKGIYNNTLIGYTLVTPYIFDLGDEFVEVTGDSICFIDEIKKLPDSNAYFITKELICLLDAGGSIALVDYQGYPLDITFQFDFGVDSTAFPEKFLNLSEGSKAIPLHEYYPYGFSYDEKRQWLIMCYKRSEFMADGKTDSGIAVFDLRGNLLLDLPTPEEHQAYIEQKYCCQVAKSSVWNVKYFEMLPVEGEPLAIPVIGDSFEDMCLLVDLERQSWELVEREQIDAMLQGSGWHMDWEAYFDKYRLLPDQEPVELTIVPGEESTKLFFGDSKEPVFEIEGCYTADGYMIDKATGDIYTCLEQVSPGYGDIS